jgi:hypothetical protein
MDKSQLLFRRASSWLGRYHIHTVILLSALHIGLACIHVRDSGGADTQGTPE